VFDLSDTLVISDSFPFGIDTGPIDSLVEWLGLGLVSRSGIPNS